MEVQDLKHMIQSKNIPSFLIFTGEEWKIQQLYIQQIAKVKKLEVKTIDSIHDIWNTLNSKILIGKNYLYVLQDDKEFYTEEKLYYQIVNRLNQNMLILKLSSVDKRLRILKTYNNTTFEFNALKSDVLKRYIQREIDLSDRNCEALMEVCENNYGRCLLEIDKLLNALNFYRANYKLGRGENEIDLGSCYNPEQIVRRLDINMLFEDFLKDGTIYVPPRDVIFDFIKAVLQNKVQKSFSLLEELKEADTPTFIILTNLYNLTKWTYQLQTCNNKNIAKSTGLNNWQIRNAKECTGRFSNEDLEYLIRLIQKVESGIKRGIIEESIAVDYVLASFL